MPIFLICYLSYMMLYVARLNLSMGASALKKLAVLTTAQIGLLGSLFSVVYTCGRLLSGQLADRTVPWLMICTGLVLCGSSNLVLSLLPAFPAFLLLWAVNAFGQSMLWGPILRILSAIYPEDMAKKRASYMGTAIATGNMAAIVLHNFLIERLGVRWVFAFPGMIILALSLCAVLGAHRIQTDRGPVQTHSFFSLFRRRELRRMLLPAVIHGVMKDNISLWMSVYVIEQFGVDLSQSSYFILLIPALGFVGRLLAPGLYRLSSGREQPLLIGSYAVCAFCSALLIAFPFSAPAAVAYLSLIYMAVSVINACLLAFYPIAFAREGLVASVSGLMDFATYLGTGFSAMVFGIMIDHLGYGSMFAVWAVLSLLAIPLLSFHPSEEVIQ